MFQDYYFLNHLKKSKHIFAKFFPFLYIFLHSLLNNLPFCWPMISESNKILTHAHCEFIWQLGFQHFVWDHYYMLVIRFLKANRISWNAWHNVSLGKSHKVTWYFRLRKPEKEHHLCGKWFTILHIPSVRHSQRNDHQK